MRNRHYHRLWRSNEGIATLEFALIAPMFLLTIMAVIEFAMIMFTMTVMESATDNTARLGKTGYTAGGSSRQSQIVANLASRTTGLLDPSKITITSEVYPVFTDVNQPEPCLTPKCGAGVAGVDYTDVNGNGQWDSDMGVAGLGNAGDIVVYTVSYPWPIMTPIVAAIIGKTFTITVRTVVQNEPYS
jgi:hypothetical protein